MAVEALEEAREREARERLVEALEEARERLVETLEEVEPVRRGGELG